MRKIYFFLPDYPNWGTGGHKYHTILFEYFKRKSSLIYSFGHNKYSYYSERNKFLKIITGIYYSFKIPKNSVLIMTNASFLNYFFPVLINKKRKNHFYFLIIHHLSNDEKPGFLRNKLENFFIRNSDMIVTVSAATREKLYNMNTGQEKIEIFNPGLEIHSEKISGKKTMSGKLKLLFVGLIEERKGILYLLEALKLISSVDFELNIIGEVLNSNQYYDLLQKKISEYNLEGKVFFRGKVSKNELEDYYLNSSVFVFPTLWEGYGMVVSEAMSYGLPVIASRIPAIEELIDDGVNGILVEPKNAVQISEKIRLLNSDHSLMEKLSENAVKKSQSFPTWDETCEGIYNLVRKIN